ncbi:flagellin [Sinorhizobium medicae]|uniref:flagellin N-terminal helical domain-containing protein n=1 Tax=Sinorhizobium medicae TaxID=110321 RepID=UPI000FD9FBBE|nr:flagellin [Sinorhizobium medicae]MDX0601432.1 flagellin [Sinorhizobium medicae]MDX0817664.1 flagellin [Sinorhizobium medicae]MDX0860555.1 flagellin [Sinorhizobium medicae]RVJ34115.1 flagellin [Sinorhizobium medicae]
MTSILTNNSAMAALSTLRSISSSMEDTQSRISSGLRVGSASDNAAYWSIATTMRSDNQALSAVQDALGLGAAKVDTAYSGMESAIEVVKEIKAKLVAATEDGVDKAKIQEEITQLKDQLTSIAEAASFSGENWLQADLSGGAVTKSVVGSFVRDASGSVSVKKVDYSLNANSVLFDTVGDTGILDKVYDVSQASVTLTVNTNGVESQHTVAAYSLESFTEAGAEFQGNYALQGGNSYVKVENVWVRAETATAGATGQEIAATTTAAGTITADSWVVDVDNEPAVSVSAGQSVAGINIVGMGAAALDALISGVDAALTDMTSAAASLGSISSRIDLQSEFVNKLSDSIDSGVGRLVDADMNEESTRLKALQTQQQLAIQALSIANSDSQNVLSLFR